MLLIVLITFVPASVRGCAFVLSALAFTSPYGPVGRETSPNLMSIFHPPFFFEIVLFCSRTGLELTV